MRTLEGDLVARIVSPLPGELPAGVDLRLDGSPTSLYYRLRDGRAEARAGERQSESDPDAVAAPAEHWRRVVDLAVGALVGQTKDVEIAAWLVEGLVRSDGLSGLTVGAQALAGLIGGFWSNGLHPAPEDDDIWATLAAVSGLSGQDRDGTLIQPLRNTELFELPDGTPVTFWLYERAREVSTLDRDKAKESRAAKRIPAFADVEMVARGPGRPSLASVGVCVDEALAAWKTLDAAIEATGARSVATGRVSSVLDRIRHIVARYVPEAGQAPKTEPAPDVAPPINAKTDGLEPPPSTAHPSASREVMLDEVLTIARIFREREPNSPFGLTLEEAVRRARLPVTDLLRELLPDVASRAPLLLALGIRAQPE